MAPDAAAGGGRPRILIFGGSQGAHAINMAMVAAAPRLATHPGGLAITHQTGERDVAVVRDGYARAGLDARVEPFLFAMDREMKAADVVIARSGATTLAELAAARRPAILIPLPTAADDHQPQHQRRPAPGRLPIRPEADRPGALPGVAQALEQSHVGPDPDQELPAAVDQGPPILVADEAGHNRHFRALMRPALVQIGGIGNDGRPLT